MASWMVTTEHHQQGDQVTSCVNLPDEDAEHYVRFSVRMAGNGHVTTMVRVDKCKKTEALARAAEEADALIGVLGGWIVDAAG